MVVGGNDERCRTAFKSNMLVSWNLLYVWYLEAFHVSMVMKYIRTFHVNTFTEHVRFNTKRSYKNSSPYLSIVIRRIAQEHCIGTHDMKKGIIGQRVIAQLYVWKWNINESNSRFKAFLILWSKFKFAMLPFPGFKPPPPPTVGIHSSFV